jgi:hypothetical protein
LGSPRAESRSCPRRSFRFPRRAKPLSMSGMVWSRRCLGGRLARRLTPMAGAAPAHAADSVRALRPSGHAALGALEDARYLPLGRSSVVDCLDAKTLELFKVVPHVLEHLRGVSLPVQDLADYTQWLPGAVDLVGLPGNLLSVRLGSSDFALLTMLGFVAPNLRGGHRLQHREPRRGTRPPIISKRSRRPYGRRWRAVLGPSDPDAARSCSVAHANQKRRQTCTSPKGKSAGQPPFPRQTSGLGAPLIKRRSTAQTIHASF